MKSIPNAKILACGPDPARLIDQGRGKQTNINSLEFKIDLVSFGLYALALILR
jgi:hypothetical protein